MRTITFFILFFYFNNCYELLAQSISNDSISMFVNDSLNEELIAKTRIYLIEIGFKPLSCQSPSCASHLWKKNKNGKYSNVHQIGNTPYFRECEHKNNLVANKKATGHAKYLSKLEEPSMNLLDQNNDFIITETEIRKYNRKKREEYESNKK